MRNLISPINGVGKSFLGILRDGASEPGDCGHSTTEIPAWLDKEMLIRVKSIYEEHCPGILLGHFMGPIMLSQMESMIQPLVYTRNSYPSNKANKRAFKTLDFMISCYKGRIWESDDKARKAFAAIRKLHVLKINIINKALPKHSSGGPWVSQLDMALGQFSFCGPLLLYGEEMGLFCTQDELECILHLWRYIGFLLGMEDRFNMGNYPFEDILATCRDIVTEICVPTFTNPVEEFTANANMGYGYLSPHIEYNTIHNYACQLMGTDSMLCILSWKGYICMWVLWFMPKFLSYEYVRKLAAPTCSRLLEMKIDFEITKKNEISDSVKVESAL